MGKSKNNSKVTNLGFFRKHWVKAIFWLSGIIIGAIIGTTSDRITEIFFPQEPIVIKELKDSIQVLHSIKVETKELSLIKEDSINRILLQKLNKLEEIENYQKLIDEKISELNIYNEIENAKFLNQYYNSFIDPDEIFLKTRKGFTSNPIVETDYIIADCPEYQSGFFNIVLQLADTTLLEKTACISVLIKLEETQDGEIKTVFYQEKHYRPKAGINVLRIKSPFYKKGAYSISFGLILKKDAGEEFPFLHKKTCHVTVV